MPSKNRPRPPSPTPSVTPPRDPLDQLKQSLSTEGSIIKNPRDAKKHLEKAGLLSPDQAPSQTTFAEILLSLVVTTSTRKPSSDKIPERIANIIKAIALLLDETNTSPIIDTQAIPPPISTEPPPTTLQQQPPTPDIARQLEDNASFIRQATATHAENTAKVNALIDRFERLQERTEKSISDLETASPRDQTTNTSAAPSYRDALINGKHNPSAHTPTQHRLLNRLGIKACQILLDFEQDAHLRLTKPDSPDTTTPGILTKSALNSWLDSPEDRNGPIPKRTAVRVVRIFGNSRILIEMNSPEAADWMRANAERILGEIFGCKTSILTRSFTVIARFVPVNFDISPANLRSMEDDLALPANSLVNATWIKDPSKRANDQKYANLKIFCSTPETANTLITGPAFILSSRLCIQKEIKTPGVCNKCQRYGHLARDCKETNDTCGFCGQGHRSSLCNKADTYKCTPCGSTDHPTNHYQCPIYSRLAQAIVDRDPETTSAYFLTDEPWTWGNHSNQADKAPPPPGTFPFRKGTTLGSKRTNNPTQRSQPQRQHQQRTLSEEGFTIRPSAATPRNNPPPPARACAPSPSPNPNFIPIPTRNETVTPEAGSAPSPAQ